MTLRKTDLINLLGSLDLTKSESLRLIESVISIIKDELAKGKEIKISGFGKWTVKQKKERKGRNPQSGESMTICARKVVTFKPSPVLRDAINREG